MTSRNNREVDPIRVEDVSVAPIGLVGADQVTGVGALTRKPVLLAWQAGNTTGWGVAGLNIFQHWMMSDEVEPLMAAPFASAAPMDGNPASVHRFSVHLVNSNVFSTRLAQAGQAVQLDMPVVHALGNTFDPLAAITGTRNVARLVFESTAFAPILPKLERYDTIVCASEWNAGLLQDRLRTPVRVIPEGADEALFHPGPKLGLLSPDRFYIFSGGKAEFRKAQDVVLRAFREFSRRHDDAVLVTCWRSPWPSLGDGLQGHLEAPLRLRSDGDLDIARWAGENGVDPAKVIDIGRLPNQVMPRFLREMDCALQPSRGEGGTNMIAMEAMSCGLPTILARNTGVADIITADNCIALDRQTPIEEPPPGWGVDGWGESDPEEIVEALERLYTSPDLRRAIGERGAAFMRSRNWAGHAETLKDVALGT